MRTRGVGRDHRFEPGPGVSGSGPPSASGVAAPGGSAFEATRGTVALHGGGEFLPGDERFLRAILRDAPRTDEAVRVCVVPTAAARGRPELAAANGVQAFTGIAGDMGMPIRAIPVPVVDVASAGDRGLAELLARADVIHLPGGDPDLIPSLLSGSAAWAAIIIALARGAVLAGASAGAMALGAVTWTPGGIVPGLGLVPGVVVMPHADARSWAVSLHRFGGAAPAGIGILGLGERTGVFIERDGPWRVVGEHEIRWLPAGERDPDRAVVLRDGGLLTARTVD